MNIVSMAMRYLGPTIATKAASMLGIKSPMMVKLIAAALPTILGALSGKASTSSGAGSLFSLLSKPDVGDPAGLEAALDAGNAADMSASGAGMLNDLLGGNAMNSITGALGRYGGAGEAETKSMLGMIAPVALGSLKQQVQEQNLDADGLAQMLAGQKHNIAEAVPADFASEMSGLGLIDMPSAASAATAATQAVETATEKAGGGMMKWLIGAIVLAGLAWFFLGGKPAPEMPDLASADFAVGEVNVGEQFGTVVDGVKETFGTITDTASAEAAIPQLNDFNTQLDGISGLKDQLPEAAQGAFGGIVGTAITTLKPMIDGAVEASGAGAILQPIVDTMMEKLTAMAG